MNERKYQYRYFNSMGDRGRLLVCPECEEPLRHEDIEAYKLCPYCDYAFDEDNEFDDFVLQPVAEFWARQQNGVERVMIETLPAPACPAANN